MTEKIIFNVFVFWDIRHQTNAKLDGAPNEYEP